MAAVACAAECGRLVVALVVAAELGAALVLDADGGCCEPEFDPGGPADTRGLGAPGPAGLLRLNSIVSAILTDVVDELGGAVVTAIELTCETRDVAEAELDCVTADCVVTA